MAALFRFTTAWLAAAGVARAGASSVRQPDSLARQTPWSQQDRQLGDGCYHVFIDVGSKRGERGQLVFEPKKQSGDDGVAEALLETFVHGQLVFEQEKQSGRDGLAVALDETFGKDRRSQDMCVFAFEPDLRYQGDQESAMNAYRRLGLRYHHVQAAAGDRDMPVTLGAAVEGLPVVDFSAWLEHHIFSRSIPRRGSRNVGRPAVVMGMDIEGPEYKTLVNLLTKGTLCKFDRSVAVVRGRAPVALKKRRLETAAEVETLLRSLNNLLGAAGCGQLELLTPVPKPAAAVELSGMGAVELAAPPDPPTFDFMKVTIVNQFHWPVLEASLGSLLNNTDYTKNLAIFSVDDLSHKLCQSTLPDPKQCIRWSETFDASSDYKAGNYTQLIWLKWKVVRKVLQWPGVTKVVFLDADVAVMAPFEQDVNVTDVDFMFSPELLPDVTMNGGQLWFQRTDAAFAYIDKVLQNDGASDKLDQDYAWVALAAVPGLRWRHLPTDRFLSYCWTERGQAALSSRSRTLHTCCEGMREKKMQLLRDSHKQYLTFIMNAGPTSE